MIDVNSVAGILRDRLGMEPVVGMVLGSGLGGVADGVEDAVEVSFEELPGFPPAGVEGHAGRFVGGRLGGRTVLIQAGRYHVYEGHPAEVVAGPVRVMAAMGIPRLVLTNAAGGVDPLLEPGDLMLLDDHINFMGHHPLVGPVQPGEERFPDMSAPYDGALRALALEVAKEEGIPLSEGVYAAVTGPSYETPAEVRMLGSLGAHAVGMSTVPEATVAAALGMRCVAFSMITNKAAGLSLAPLAHDEVMEVGAAAGVRLARLVERLVERLPEGQSAGVK